jgi:uncharacterized cupin superfamily protein
MPIQKLPVSSNAEAETLQDWGPVGLPLSQPPCMLRGAKMAAPIDNAPEMGVWECAPGRYRRQIRSAETMHIVSGKATFRPDNGEPVVLEAGDVFFFPPETLGVWEIHSALRKVYVIFTPGRT